MYHLSKPRQIRAVARFRCGSHRLGVRTGQFGAGGRVPRSQRVCSRCGCGRVDDELHLMECSCFADLRGQFAGTSCPQAGWSDESFKGCMNPTTERGWRDLADYLIGCQELAGV